MTLAFSHLDPGTPLTVALTNYPPNGVTALARTRSVLSVQAAPVLYLTLTTGNSLSGTAALSAAPSFTFSVVDTGFVQSGQQYYLALFDSSQSAIGWQAPFGGPASFSGSSITIGANSAMTFASNVTYTFALYPSSAGALPAPPTSLGPSPTPQPTATAVATATPSAAPTGAGIGFTIGVPPVPPVVAQAANPLTFAATGAAFAQRITLSEAGYGSSFAATSLEPNVASAAVVLGDGNNYTLVVTPVSPGVAEIQLSSRNGGFGSVGVIVTGP